MAKLMFNIKSTNTNKGFVSYVRSGSDIAWSFDDCVKIVTKLAGDDRYIGVMFDIELA